jgi:hypothetical protein
VSPDLSFLYRRVLGPVPCRTCHVPVCWMAVPGSARLGEWRERRRLGNGHRVWDRKHRCWM